MKKIRAIYLDNAATTPIRPEVLKVMQLFFAVHYGNPSALYKEGVAAQAALTAARKTIASLLHSTPDTLIFTSGGTEADNLAILGAARAHSKHGKHIISVATEHDAVLAPLKQLETEGFEVTYVPVDQDGVVSAQAVMKAIKPSTILISVMYANNEIGTIQPIADIGRHILRYRKEQGSMYPLFHTDAAQAAGYLELDVEKSHVDLMTLNSGKIYGPKGVGVLYVRRGTALTPIMFGGSQERSLRAGTENVPGIVGFAKALELVQNEREGETKRLQSVSKMLYEKLCRHFPQITLNGPDFGEVRLPNNVNIEFPHVDGEALVLYLDSFGVMCSTGSACTAVSREPSHVLRAIGKTSEQIASSVRFSLGRDTTAKDVEYVVEAVGEALRLCAQVRA